MLSAGNCFSQIYQRFQWRDIAGFCSFVCSRQALSSFLFALHNTRTAFPSGLFVSCGTTHFFFVSQSPSVEATALRKQCGLFCHLRFELKTSKHSVRGVFFQKRFTIGSQFTRRHDGDIIAYLAPSPMHIPTRLGVNHADHVYHAKHVKSRKSCKSRK